MSLPAADGHAALFVTDEGDARRIPLVRRRDDGTSVHGMVRYRDARTGTQVTAPRTRL
ncbi:DUF6253 family protein [Streptomyces sp. NPDC048291]|uniref:DUF6253 family protein n=1 Tax=Streptomyces sp. NPDC048291 TaxID=3365530 RepID=UPI00371648FC